MEPSLDHARLKELCELYSRGLLTGDVAGLFAGGLRAALAKIEALERERDKDYAGMREFQAKFIAADLERRELQEQVAALEKDGDTLRARCGELEQDKARLDWLEGNTKSGNAPKVWKLHGETIREAIDAARVPPTTADGAQAHAGRDEGADRAKGGTPA